MAKINSKALDPQRYACIQAEQRELEQQYSTHITMARLCPYCKLRLETLCKGAHGAYEPRSRLMRDHPMCRLICNDRSF